MKVLFKTRGWGFVEAPEMKEWYTLNNPIYYCIHMPCYKQAIKERFYKNFPCSDRGPRERCGYCDMRPPNKVADRLVTMIKFLKLNERED